MVAYSCNVLIFIGIYTILASGLNLIAGTTGMVSCCQAAFFAIGAYSSTLLILKLGIPFIIALLLGVVVTATFGYLIGFPSIQLRGDFLAIGTLGFGEVMNVILNNWISLTDGPRGISGIPHPKIFSLTIDSIYMYVLFTWIFVGITVFLIRRIENSPFARILFSIKNDEIASLAAGINVKKYKLLAFVIGSSFAGIAGTLYAHYTTFIDPASFLVNESILILAMIVLGGLGNIFGSMVGAAILISVPEILRFLGMPSDVAANMRQMLYGFVLIVMVMFRPQGLIIRKRV
jgi:branched-chain amino acid transport system permease protein